MTRALVAFEARLQSLAGDGYEHRQLLYALGALEKAPKLPDILKVRDGR